MKLFLSTLIFLTFQFLHAQDIDAIVTNPLCFGEDSGSIDIEFTGGTPPYMYEWNNGANTEDLDFLIGGFYSLTISDSQSQNFVGEWIIDEPTPITLDGIIQDPYCNINNGLPYGSIDLVVAGGTDDFTFMWDGPGVTNASDSNLSNLSGGVYSVTVTDTNGCSETMDLFLIEPDEIIIDANVHNLDCILGQSQFGSIQLDVFGGFAPYTYDWSGTVSNPSAESQFDLIAGNYAVAVTDANGCSAAQEYELTGAEPISISSTITNIDCDNAQTILGNIVLNLNGGTPPYAYSWTGTDVDPSAQNQTNLDEGVYSVTVSDGDGCQMVEETFEVHTNFIAAPSLCLITNDNPDGYNAVYWEGPEDLTGVDQYNIYREGSSVGQFDLIGTIDEVSDNEFFDTDANSIQQAYRYYVTSANACGYESEPSAIHKTIHLTINQGSLGNINLIWDQYDGIEYDQIVIYRGDSPSTLEEFVMLPGNVFSYTDDNTLPGDAYYQIVITTSVECNTGLPPQKLVFELKSNVAGYFVNSVENIDWLSEVYPNPFENNITISVEVSAKAEIIDYQGNKVADYKLSPGVNTLSTIDLSKGMYIVRIISNGEAVIWRGLKA